MNLSLHDTSRTTPDRFRWTMVLAALMLSGGAVGHAQETGYSLERALTVMRQTPDWRAALLTYQNAQRSLETALAGTGIHLSTSGNYNLTQVTSTSAAANSNASVSVTASANVLPWSAANDTVRNARRALERAALTRRDALNNLALGTISAYFNARNASLTLQAAQANEALLDTRLRVATQQYQNGQITFTDFLAAQQNLAGGQFSALSAQNTRDIALAQLGLDSGTVFTTVPSLLGLPLGTPEQLMQGALGRRADVLQAISRVQDAEDALSNAQRNRLVPNASLSLGFGQLGATGTLGSPSVTGSLNVQTGTASVTGSLPLTQSTPASTTGISLGVSASFPILGPSLDAAINAAQTALEAAHANLDAVRRAAALDVAQRLSTAQIATAQVRVAQGVLETANKALETATARYQSGLNTTIDLEAARVNVLQAQANLETALASQVNAVYQLQHAIGSLNLLPENR